MHPVDLISSAEAGNLAGLLRCRAGRTPDAAAYRQFDNASGQWRRYRWSEIAEEVARWRQALAAAGLEAGDRVALMLQNSVEWVLFDQAALSLGLVVVPLYTQDNSGNAAFVLGDSGSRLLLVGEDAQWQGLARHSELFPGLETVVALDRVPQPKSGLRTHQLNGWLADASPAPATEADPDKLATIVYTSGTTGRPKGVMLSHANILSNAEAISGAVPAYPDDVFLSFLPLSHMLERTAGYYYPMMTGSEVVYARSVQTLAADLQSIRPTVLISVPRIFERAYSRIEEQLARKGALARRLFAFAEETGWQRFEWSQGRQPRPTVTRRMVWPLLRAVVVKKILARLGGRLRLTVSGGGRLDDHIARRFLGFGLPILQGYGLTEASPVVSGNTFENNAPESVGRALPGVQARIGEAGELLVSGPGVMQGYWQRPDATVETVDGDGWLHTGDVAEIIDGRIFIRGRIKDILVTSTGEKVPPADLEAAIARDPLFEQVLIVGEGKPYVAALIVLQDEEWGRLAGKLGLDRDNPDALRAEAVNTAVLARIEPLLQEFPAYARVRAVRLSLQPWTIGNGLITPTQKLRRQLIMERFKDAVHALYAGH